LATVPEKANAIIWYIAARRCLKENLEMLYENFNREYQYPVIVYSFGEKYDSKFKRNIWENIDSSIQFVTLDEPTIPERIPESEVFYSRTELDYVREYFPASRVGYLHTNQFVSGLIMHRPEIAQYDFGLKMDDDTFFVKKIPNDILLEASQKGWVFAPSDTKNYNHDRAMQTQIGLRDLYAEYFSDANIVPLSDSIDESGEWNGDGPWDPTIWDFRIFRDEKWDKWWRMVDDAGGIYKYRWGDLEVQTLFVKSHYPDSAWHDMKLYDHELVVHGGYGPVYTWQNSIAGRIVHNVILNPRGFAEKLIGMIRRN